MVHGNRLPQWETKKINLWEKLKNSLGPCVRWCPPSSLIFLEIFFFFSKSQNLFSNFSQMTNNSFFYNFSYYYQTEHSVLKLKKMHRFWSFPPILCCIYRTLNQDIAAEKVIWSNEGRVVTWENRGFFFFLSFSWNAT